MHCVYGASNFTLHEGVHQISDQARLREFVNVQAE
jgi:hypothetical protein